MISVQTFTFNAFSENTYVLFNDESKDKDCVIIDPGCNNLEECNALQQFINKKHLSPKHLLNTHCHLDHVFGNKFVYDTFGLKPRFHKLELPVLANVITYAPLIGHAYQPSPIPLEEELLKTDDEISFGNNVLKALFTPGHSPGSLSFYSEKDALLIAGDTLFYRSIGRSDLPGGDAETLLSSIKNQFFTLPDEVTVYPGHGPQTSILSEKKYNTYLQ